MNILMQKLYMNFLRDEKDGGSGGSDDWQGLGGGDDTGTGDGNDGGEGSDGKEDEAGDDDGKGEADDGGVDDAGEYVDDPDLSDEENAAAKEAFEAGKGDGDDEGDEDGKKKKDEGDDDDDDEETLKAGDYELDFAGRESDVEVEAEFREFAEEAGLSQEQVNKLTGIQTKMEQKRHEATAQLVKKWEKDLRADKEIGGPEFEKSSAIALTVVDQVFVPLDPNFKAMMNQTGLGHYPPFVKGMYQIGKMMSEAQIEIGKGKNKESSISEDLYGAEGE